VRLNYSMSLPASHAGRFLQTPYDDASLAKKLFRVYHEGRSAVEEQGYTVAHLALGFLEWYESDDSDQPRRAPLLLVPAELERVRAAEFSRVRWTSEEVFANISLQAKLVEFGISLPPFEAPDEKSGIDIWFQQVAAAIAKKPRWYVVDANPSRIAVIEDVKAGRNLVVEGPPGTGKSQTITNLIAETLAAGRTVLFVSEKMAALAVVKSRLDTAGLGPFCLELHSR